MPEKTHHAAQAKKEVVKKITKYIQDYPIIGIVNMENLPTAQLQRMRHQLRGKIELFMTKIKLINLAINESKQAKKGIEQLQQYVKRMPALLFTKENPFTLFKTLKKSKSQAPAKGGQIAPRDIMVPAGPTPFAPGPVISEFAALGIKAGVEGGKVAVKQDTIVCKEGKQISAPLASMLTRLGIEPMEVGLDLIAVYENGTIYPKNVLDIDEKSFLNNIMIAATESFNLAIEITLPMKDTIETLLQKAFKEAKAVALEGNIMTDLLAAELVEKAEREMLALKNTANITTNVPKEIVKEVPKQVVTETNKEEVKTPKPVEKPVVKSVDKPVDNVHKAVSEMVGELKKHETLKPSAEEIIEEAKKVQQPESQQKQAQTNKEIDEVEALTKKLMKKGTLR